MSPAHPEKRPVLVVHGGVDEQLLKDCLGLLVAAEESDGNPSLSEQTVVTLRAGYGEWLAAAEALLGGLERPARDRVLGENANACYQLDGVRL